MLQHSAPPSATVMLSTSSPIPPIFLLARGTARCATKPTALVPVITRLVDCVLSGTRLSRSSNRFCQPLRLLCTSHFLSRFSVVTTVLASQSAKNPELLRGSDVASLFLRNCVLSSLFPVACSYRLQHHHGSAPLMVGCAWKEEFGVSRATGQPSQSLQAQVKDLSTSMSCLLS